MQISIIKATPAAQQPNDMTPFISPKLLGFPGALSLGSKSRESSHCSTPAAGSSFFSAPRRLSSLSSRSRPGKAGFTLVELLVVIAIIVVMMTLIVPSFTSIRGAGDLTKAAYDIAGILSQARAYAMANNTYVWVGIEEVDVTQSQGARPQRSGTGSVILAVMAAKDGTRGYDVTASLTAPVWTGTGVSGSFVPIGKAQRFDNIHLAAPGVMNGGNLSITGSTTGVGGMKRPFVSDDGSTSTPPAVLIGNASTTSSRIVTQFAWPLGATLNTPQSQYNFTTVINFDPQGVARVQTQTNQDNLGQYFELGLQQTHGAIVSGTSNVAAVQVDCMTGATKIYRP